MASNDEYQQQQFWEEEQPTIICFVKEVEINFKKRQQEELEYWFGKSHDAIMQKVNKLKNQS